MTGPDPSNKHPMAPAHSRVGFLKPIVEGSDNIEVGDFTYYDDPNGPEKFVERCVLYHYPFVGDRLIIGRFCALAEGARFIMNGANHAMSGFSTFPFNIFGGGWEEGFSSESWEMENRGDTVIGHDVWLGTQVTVMPGVVIGHGAIIASHSVVVSDVAPYTIAGGNPAREIRRRFDEKTIEQLLNIAWWDWSVEKISRNLNAIRGADLARLEAAQ